MGASGDTVVSWQHFAGVLPASAGRLLTLVSPQQEVAEEQLQGLAVQKQQHSPTITFRVGLWVVSLLEPTLPKHSTY